MPQCDPSPLKYPLQSAEFDGIEGVRENPNLSLVIFAWILTPKYRMTAVTAAAASESSASMAAAAASLEVEEVAVASSAAGVVIIGGRLVTPVAAGVTSRPLSRWVPALLAPRLAALNAEAKIRPLQPR